jgi:hypothetical protein
MLGMPYFLLAVIGFRVYRGLKNAAPTNPPES